jgi:hypothetical protein
MILAKYRKLHTLGMLQTEARLITVLMIVIYDCKTFIVRATGRQGRAMPRFTMEKFTFCHTPYLKTKMPWRKYIKRERREERGERREERGEVTFLGIVFFVATFTRQATTILIRDHFEGTPVDG